MNAPGLPATISASVPALAMDERELMAVLQSSLYPGAKAESIKLVLGYCKASGLDPMQKPVHIVPISVKQGDNYVMRDTVMPGIGLYRTQASRTGEYAGITEPEFGPTKQLKVGEFTMDYPEWCRVTVKRRCGGTVVDFTANERWTENYATQKRDSQVPNAMWKRRPFAQLAKCAEAQALRKAFPELVGGAPTAEEMEGKPYEDGVIIEHSTQQPEKPAGPQPYPVEAFEKNLPAWTKLIMDGKKTAEQIVATVSSKAVLSDQQKATITKIQRTVDDATKKPATIDHDTGEINGSGAPVVNYGALLARLRTGKDVDTLDLDASLIGQIEGQDRQNTLAKAYQDRRAELATQ